MRDLTTDEIRACATGTSQIRETEAGLELLRFSETHLRYWHDLGLEAKLVRVYCDAGITLDFVTDSDSLFLEAALGKAARPPAFFDVWVDDVFVAYIGSAEPGDTVSGEVRLPAPGEMRRVTIYLPHLRATYLRSVSLSDGARLEVAPARKTLLTLGDSITQGMSSPHGSLTYTSVLARQLGLTQHNQGVGGGVYSADTLADPPVEDPALITVAFGVNDWNNARPPSNAGSYLERLRGFYPDRPIVVFEPTWFSNGDGEHAPKVDRGTTFEEYRQALRDIVAGFDSVTIVPWQQLLPAGHSLVPDGCHPNAPGHVVYGMNAARAIN